MVEFVGGVGAKTKGYRGQRIENRKCPDTVCGVLYISKVLKIG